MIQVIEPSHQEKVEMYNVLDKRELIEANNTIRRLAPKPVVQSCMHDWDEGFNNVSKCKKCGKYSA